MDTHFTGHLSIFVFTEIHLRIDSSQILIVQIILCRNMFRTRISSHLSRSGERTLDRPTDAIIVQLIWCFEELYTNMGRTFVTSRRHLWLFGQHLYPSWSTPPVQHFHPLPFCRFALWIWQNSPGFPLNSLGSGCWSQFRIHCNHNHCWIRTMSFPGHTHTHTHLRQSLEPHHGCCRREPLHRLGFTPFAAQILDAIVGHVGLDVAQVHGNDLGTRWFVRAIGGHHGNHSGLLVVVQIVAGSVRVSIRFRIAIGLLHWVGE